MEELLDIENYDDKLKDIKAKVSKTEKTKPKDESLSKDDKKLKSKNKCQKYIILILSCIILFITYHLLLQNIDNLNNQLYIKEKLLLNYQKNINGSLKELEQVEYENDVLKKEINQYKEKYVQYNEEYQKLKKENDKIVEYSKQLYSISNKYRKKYNEYKKEFETISNTFHSFFDTK